jgi:hypothetical protein
LKLPTLFDSTKPAGSVALEAICYSNAYASAAETPCPPGGGISLQPSMDALLRHEIWIGLV